MEWQESWRADPLARALADRHYSRQTIGATQFVPPGRCLVLRTPAADAFWITSWPYAEYVKHAWPGAWMCSAFRNESPRRRKRGYQSSALIRQAIAATLWKWPTPPPLGMVSFVDSEQVKTKTQPGECFLAAGFCFVGRTQAGLLAFQILPESMPAAQAPLSDQTELFA